MYEKIAWRLNKSSQDFCDQQAQEKRVLLARVMDKVGDKLSSLWKTRTAEDFPRLKMAQVGPLFLRLPEKKEAKKGFSVTHWSWEDAYGTYLRTQRDMHHPETKKRWRDLDTAFRFLMERDAGRIVNGKRFLPPQETQHIFRPSLAVTRTGPKKFELRLDPGDFLGYEKNLSDFLERKWSTEGYTLKIRWVTNDPAAYKVRAYFTFGRSYVDHKQKVMVIANFSSVDTVAHELGHVLGFDDHYYSVWNGQNCYYTQESRLGDLMSNSESGRVTNKHWELMDRAYPWQKAVVSENFSYLFGGL